MLSIEGQEGASTICGYMDWEILLAAKKPHEARTLYRLVVCINLEMGQINYE
jgi:hypothetical protein